MSKIPREENSPQPDSAAKIQTKYKTWELFRRGVRGVRGNVTKGERLVLGVMGDYANYRTAMTRPGDKNLIAETGLSERGVPFVRKSLAHKKLIELIQGGKSGAGQHNANLYRICIEDDRFPIPKRRNETRSSYGFEADGKPAVATGFNPNGNPVGNQTKPAVDTDETRSEGVRNPQYTSTPSLISSINTSISDTPPPANNAGGCVSPQHSPEQTQAIAFLLRFQKEIDCDLIEADARLGWINHRYLHRTDGSPSVPVKNHWLYVLKSNKNLNEQYNDAGKQAILERQRFTDQWHIPVRTCSACHDLVILGMKCDCGSE